jgi:uncharacterized protein (UPF0248 family)
MKNLKDIIFEKLIINKNTKVNNYNYHPKDRDELKELVDKLIKERGNEANLNDIDVSDIEDMSKIFYRMDFDGDISKWDVSNVKSMYKMFTRSKFSGKNGDISNWDINNVEKNFAMFRFCPMDKNRPKWYKEF